MAITIYHNPKCSKSRQALLLLQDRGITPDIVEYLKQPLTAAEIGSILDKLGFTAVDLIRKKESLFVDLKLNQASVTEKQLVQAMVNNPCLIERPIVVNGDKACLGRPPENVLEIL